MPSRTISGCFNFVIHINDTVVGIRHLQIPQQNGGREWEGRTTSKWQIMVDKPDTINCTSNQIIQPDYTTLHCLLLSFQFITNEFYHITSYICIWKLFQNQISCGTRTNLGNNVSEECWCCKGLAWRQAGYKGCGQSELHNGDKDAAQLMPEGNVIMEKAKN